MCNQNIFSLVHSITGIVVVTCFKSWCYMQMVKDFTISSSKYCLLNYISTIFGLLSNSVGPKPKDKY